MFDFFSFTNIGYRPNNEDYILNGAIGDRSFFIVCDGVGGEACGEIASSLACNTFAGFFQKNASMTVSKDYFQQALDHIENTFDQYIAGHPETAGMATTLVLLLFDGHSAFIIHVGDSRAYQIRESRIVFQTHDHSLVNQLLDKDIITQEEAEKSTQKHVLTRAIQGKEIKEAKASFIQVDVKPDDCFFLCTDGVLESISNRQLLDILSKGDTLKEKADAIEKQCSENSRDNYSGYLIQVQSIKNP
jgi:protein phosphatase